MARKYFKSKAEARKTLSERKRNNLSCCDEIFKMPKGTGQHGQRQTGDDCCASRAPRIHCLRRAVRPRQ